MYILPPHLLANSGYASGLPMTHVLHGRGGEGGERSARASQEFAANFNLEKELANEAQGAGSGCQAARAKGILTGRGGFWCDSGNRLAAANLRAVLCHRPLACVTTHVEVRRKLDRF